MSASATPPGNRGTSGMISTTSGLSMEARRWRPGSAPGAQRCRAHTPDRNRSIRAVFARVAHGRRVALVVPDLCSLDHGKRTGRVRPVAPRSPEKNREVHPSLFLSRAFRRRASVGSTEAISEQSTSVESDRSAPALIPLPTIRTLGRAIPRTGARRVHVSF
jgi:hypothetical protein